MTWENKFVGSVCLEEIERAVSFGWHIQVEEEAEGRQGQSGREDEERTKKGKVEFLQN